MHRWGSQTKRQTSPSKEKEQSKRLVPGVGEEVVEGVKVGDGTLEKEKRAGPRVR